MFGFNFNVYVSLWKAFTPQWLLECSLWTMTLQLAKPDSQSIFVSTNSWADSWVSGYITHIIYSRVVMRFTLSPEHHSADGSSRHSRGILSSLRKMTPSPFNNAACRYGRTSCVWTEWELSLKILIKTAQFLPMGHSHWISIYIYLDFKWVHSIFLPITFRIEDSVVFSTSKSCGIAGMCISIYLGMGSSARVFVFLCT